MSEEKFAAGLGVAQSTLSRIERGLSHIPERMRASLLLLHVDVEKLLTLQTSFMLQRERAITEAIRAKLGAST